MNFTSGSLTREAPSFEMINRVHVGMNHSRTYIKNLLKNAKVVRYLTGNHAEIYSEFETIAAAEGV